MTTTIVKNTNIQELLEVSAGNLEVLKRATERFRQKVQEPLKGTAGLSGNLQFALKAPAESTTISVSTEAYRRGYRIIITVE